jgi:plastocyanin
VTRSIVVRLLFIVVVALSVALFMPGCGGGKKNPASPGGGGTGGGADVTINIAGVNGSNSFSPNPDTVMVGQSVAWKNNDSITHTATSDASAFNTGNIAPGATSTKITMGTAGSFPYHCNIHNSMTGTLVVIP